MGTKQTLREGDKVWVNFGSYKATDVIEYWEITRGKVVVYLADGRHVYLSQIERKA